MLHSPITHAMICGKRGQIKPGPDCLLPTEGWEKRKMWPNRAKPHQCCSPRLIQVNAPCPPKPHSLIRIIVRKGNLHGG